MAVMVQRRLDLQSRQCPVAVRATSNALAQMASGELIEVLATDPCTVREFASWARSTGNDLLESSKFGSVFRFVIRKV